MGGDQKEVNERYEAIGKPVYGILKAFMKLKTCYTDHCSCEYWPLLCEAKNIAGAGCKRALDELRADGLIEEVRKGVKIRTSLCRYW